MSRQTSFSTDAKKQLYIRLPDNLRSYSELTLLLNSSLAGKTLKISVADPKEIPFDYDTIAETSGDTEINFYGDSEEDWDAIDRSRLVVEGNTDCLYSECTNECHVVSCGVHQGYSSSAPLRIGCIKSKKLRDK